MVGVAGQKTGVFLYDNIKNAKECKQKGLLGWLFWTEELFEILKDKVDTILVERTENSKDFIETDIEHFKNAFKEVEAKNERD